MRIHSIKDKARRFSLKHHIVECGFEIYSLTRIGPNGTGISLKLGMDGRRFIIFLTEKEAFQLTSDLTKQLEILNVKSEGIGEEFTIDLRREE